MTKLSQTAQLEELEMRIAYQFRDRELLLRALTHRSFVKDEASLSANDHNERLEFLGDAVLSLVAAEEVFARTPHASEGVLTLLRASYVCQTHLAESARKIELGNYIRVAKAMRHGGPMDLPSLLSDVMEAIFGAAYLDSGFATAKQLILHLLGPVPQKAIYYAKDAKTELQEIFQAAFALAPIYSVVNVSGPGHAPVFVVDVLIGENVLARGEGASKKEAAQDAARHALTKVKEMDKLTLERLAKR